VINEWQVDNYPTTSGGSKKNKKLEYQRGVGLQLHLFCEAEFMELRVFGNMKLEKREPSSPKHL
jgi:hypothetical protein